VALVLPVLLALVLVLLLDPGAALSGSDRA
jgi:hypothetical protein